jgi:hypothetical protein
MLRNIDALTTADLAASANTCTAIVERPDCDGGNADGVAQNRKEETNKEEAKLAALFSEDAAADFASGGMSYQEASSMTLSRPYASATNSSPKSSLWLAPHVGSGPEYSPRRCCTSPA